MEVNEYLNMTVDELIRDFFTELINHPISAKTIIEEIARTPRYQNDDEFRTTILTAKGLILCMEGKTDQVILLTNQLISTSTNLELWALLSSNWNTLGVTYMKVGMFEKAIECFHHVVKNERKHDLLRLTASAYNNIGTIFLRNEAYERACKYFELAIDTLRNGIVFTDRYKLELQTYYGNLVIAYSEKEQLESIPAILKEIEDMDVDKATDSVKYLYYFAKMTYFFKLEEPEKAEISYLKAKKYISDDMFRLFLLTLAFLKKGLNFSLNHKLFEEELLLMERMQKTNRNFNDIVLYKVLREYYLKRGDLMKVENLSHKYIEYLEEEFKSIAHRQIESMMAMDDLMCKDDDMEAIRTKNTKLQLVVNETIKNKASLQKAYQQIDLINQLGKRITSTIQLNEVIDLIYRNVSENIPVTVFVLMVKNEENKDVLDTIAFYENGRIRPNVSIDLKNEKGIVAECYYNDKIISSCDKDYKKIFEEQRLSQKMDVNSAVYMPLRIDSEIIGVCSVQKFGGGVDIYTDEKISFLKELLPYLSIALNNAMKSRALEKEIQSHLRTQEELKKAYQQLKLISSLDGLTQINGRRVFGASLISFIEKAEKTKQSLSIIMIDIDNFKAYNDNYGHLEGDEVLKKVAKQFESIVMEAGGLSARFGGEEFIAACLGLSFEQAMELGEKIREGIFGLGLFHAFSAYQRVSVSVGVSVSEKISMEQRNEFIKEADHCLYEAKKTGKNKVVGKEI